MRRSFLAVALLVLAQSAATAVLDDTTDAVATAAGDIAHVLTSPLRMSTNDALEVGGFLAATGLIWIFDQEILDAVNRNAEEFPLKPMLEVGRWLDPIGYGSMNIYYLSGLGVSYAAGWDTGTAMFAQIVESFAVYGLLKIPVQELVGRPRPYQDEGPDAFGHDDSTSFPSGHTINAFQLATVVSHHVGRSWFTWAAYFCAASVGLQRIESDSHWPSDVFLSAVGGVAIARGIIGLHEQRRLAVTPQIGPQGLGLAMSLGF